MEPAAPDPEAPVAIVPLIHRHEVEADDDRLRHALAARPTQAMWILDTRT
jgi:hypothetical protein